MNCILIMWEKKKQVLYQKNRSFINYDDDDDADDGLELNYGFALSSLAWGQLPQPLGAFLSSSGF